MFGTNAAQATGMLTQSIQSSPPQNCLSVRFQGTADRALRRVVLTMPSPHNGISLVIRALDNMQVHVTRVCLFAAKYDVIYALELQEGDGRPVVDERRETIQAAILEIVFSCLRGARRTRGLSRAMELLPMTERAVA